MCNRLNLLWGVQPVLRDQALTAEEMLSAAEQELLRRNRVKSGDVLGVVAGTQMASGSTNFMRLHLVTAEEERGISRKGRRTTSGNGTLAECVRTDVSQCPRNSFSRRQSRLVRSGTSLDSKNLVASSQFSVRVHDSYLPNL